MSYKSLDCVAKASQLRVYHVYNINRMRKHCTEKRSIKELHRLLQANIEQSRKNLDNESSQLLHEREWYDSSHISIPQHNAQALDRELGVRLE